MREAQVHLGRVESALASQLSYRQLQPTGDIIAIQNESTWCPDNIHSTLIQQPKTVAHLSMWGLPAHLFTNDMYVISLHIAQRGRTEFRVDSRAIDQPYQNCCP